MQRAPENVVSRVWLTHVSVCECMKTMEMAISAFVSLFEDIHVFRPMFFIDSVSVALSCVCVCVCVCVFATSEFLYCI